MKAANIQHSLEDLNKKIGVCERSLCRAMKLQDGESKPRRLQGVTSSKTNLSEKVNSRQLEGTRSSDRAGRSKERTDHRISRSTSKISNNPNKSVLCKEIIKNRRGSTQVEVVVHTKPLKKRARSAQTSKHDARPGGQEGRDGCELAKPRKNPSWSHILQQQSSLQSQISHNRGELEISQSHSALQCSSSSDGLSSCELENWIKSHPGRLNTNSRTLRTSSKKATSSDHFDGYFSIFNPVRTLNFLVKELRGKIDKDCDANMQRIVEDMEKALHRIPPDSCENSPSVQPTSAKFSESHEVCWSTPCRPKSSLLESLGKRSNQKSAVHLKKPQVTAGKLDVPHMNVGGGEKVESEEKSVQTKISNHTTAASNLQNELEVNCKQLEESCRHMEEQFEKLREQAAEEKRKIGLQLEAAVNKNRQLSVYSSDIRREMQRAQRAVEAAQQENSSLKQQLLDLKREKQEAERALSQRLEEATQGIQRLTVELQMCHLEKDKMRSLLASKHLEVENLKKDIVEINGLLTEQLKTLFMVARERSIFTEANNARKDTVKRGKASCDILDGSTAFFNDMGEGEGNRSRPVCSSPTSSADSSLYSSWQLMSDISETPVDCKKPLQQDEITAIKERENMRNKVTANTYLPKDRLDEVIFSALSDNDGRLESTPNSKNLAAKTDNLKADLRQVFDMLKKQTTDAVNITLPSPPQGCKEMSEPADISQWTELSLSDSTLLHSPCLNHSRSD